MGSINLKRVLLGAALATVVLFLGELVSGLIGGEEWTEVQADMGLPDPGPWQLAAAMFMTCIYGFMLVWLYAAIRPRFGPGLRTAAIAGVVVWTLGWLLVMGSQIALGLFPAGLLLKGIAWGAVQVVAAAIVGAWAYRET